MERQAEFVERGAKQVVDVVVRLGAGAGGEDAKGGGVESRDERVTGGADDFARTDFPRSPESGAVLEGAPFPSSSTRGMVRAAFVNALIGRRCFSPAVAPVLRRPAIQLLAPPLPSGPGFPCPSHEA